MQVHFQHLIKAMILGFFVLYFNHLHSTGDILKYINPKYDYISKIAKFILIILFIVQLFRILQKKKHHHHICIAGCNHNHDHGNGQLTLMRVFGYSVMIFPIITGFTFEPATLNASIAANKGSFYSQVDQNEKPLLFEKAKSLIEKENIDIYSSEHIPLVNNNYLSTEEYDEKLKVLDSNTIEMNEDMFSSYYGSINKNPMDYIGRTIKMSGFVFKEESFNSNQLVVSRFMIVHCVADAVIIGFLSEFHGAHLLEEDTWIEIEGVLDMTIYEGMDMPIIKVTNWGVIEEPDEPYLYPVLTLIQ